jgi:hypothetical protein
VLHWIDQFLFAVKSGKHDHDGAIRKLSKNVDEVRAGVHAQVPRDLPILPALVLFDDIGDGVGILRVIDERCRRTGLLQQAGVAPIALLTLDDFESLLALATRGRGVTDLLALKATPQRREQPFKSFLYEEATGEGHLRPRLIMRLAKLLFDRSNRALFGKVSALPDPDNEAE